MMQDINPRHAIAIAVGVAVLIALPMVVKSSFAVDIFVRILLFAFIGTAWNLMGGYAKQLSLGHAAYFGLGAYGAALSFSALGLRMEAALALAPLVAALGAAVVGIFVVRLSGIYLAMLTLAAAQIVYAVAFQWVEVTGGEPVRHEVRLAPGARVSGTVRGRTGVPVPEARVTLLDPTGNLVGSATTDPDGRFGFPSLSPGEYTMITRGHFPATGSVAVPKGGRADLDLVLSPHLTARA